MAVTATPVFPQAAKIGFAKIGASANTKSSGDGTAATDIMKAFAAGANGSRIKRIRFQPVATAAATAMTSTTLRAFVSTQSSGALTGGTDTWNIGEVAGGTPSADHSTAAAAPVDIPLPPEGLYIESGQYIYGSAHVVNAANTHWQMIVEAEDL